MVTNFFWMFVEGCYLHTAIVMTYSTDKLRKWVFLFIGWCKYLGGPGMEDAEDRGRSRGLKVWRGEWDPA